MIGSEKGHVNYIEADIRHPADILEHPELRAAIDLDEPVALTVIAIMMLLPDAEDPWGHVRTLMDALPSGSHVAISHPGRDFDPEAMDAVPAMAARARKP